MTPPDRSRPRNRARRTRPLAFALVWFLLTGVLSIAASSWQDAQGWPDGDVLEIVMLAPAVAAALTWPALRRRLPDAPRALSLTAFGWRCGVALSWAIAVYVFVAVLAGDPGAVPASVAGTPIVVVLLLQILGALGEEIGYRGVLLTTLLSRYSVPTAVVLDGVIFGVVHIGYWSLGPGQVGLFVLTTVALVAAMTALFQGSFWQRVCVTTLMHGGMNIALFAVGDRVRLWEVAAAAWIATAALLAVRMPYARARGATRVASSSSAEVRPPEQH